MSYFPYPGIADMRRDRAKNTSTGRHESKDWKDPPPATPSASILLHSLCFLLGDGGVISRRIALFIENPTPFRPTRHLCNHAQV
jgi:hypothetical protein